jgi:hypothetical protein
MVFLVGLLGFFWMGFLLSTLVQGGAGGMARPALPVRGTPPGMPPPGYHHSTAAANSSSPQLSAATNHRLLSRSRAQSNLSVNTSIEVGAAAFLYCA